MNEEDIIRFSSRDRMQGLSIIKSMMGSYARYDQAMEAVRRVARVNSDLVPLPVVQPLQPFPLYFVNPKNPCRVLVVGFGRKAGIENAPWFAHGADAAALIELPPGGLIRLLNQEDGWGVKVLSGESGNWTPEFERRLARELER